MTPEEIVRDFRAAKNSYKQISILAQLNDCRKENIIDILRAQGLTEDEIYAGKPGRKVQTGKKPEPFKLVQEESEAEDEPVEAESEVEPVVEPVEEQEGLDRAIDVVRSHMSVLAAEIELAKQRYADLVMELEAADADIKAGQAKYDRYRDVVSALEELADAV